MHQKILLLSLFCLFSSSVFGQFRPGDFVNYTVPDSKTDLIEELPEYNSYINWTSGKVVTKGFVPITYSDPNIGRNVADLTSKLKDQLIEFLLKSVLKVRVSSLFPIENLFQRNERVKLQILSGLYSLQVENTVVSGSQMIGNMSFPLFGKNSISESFYYNIPSITVTNYLQRENINSSYYDTLIIDMVMFNQFQASLMPRILDQKGAVIHDISTVDRAILQTQSPVHYVTSISEAFNHPVRGKRVAYVLPAETSGASASDIVLFDTDVKRIFSQQRTIDNLRKGRVIVISSAKGLKK